MRRLIIFLFLIQLFYVRSQKSVSDKNSINTIIGIIDKRDSKCLFEIEKAKIDFKTQEILYEIMPEGYRDASYGRHHIILGQLLKKKGIHFLQSQEPEFDLFWTGTDEENYQSKTNCYCKSFNALLNLKYGHDFTKNIKHTADSLYVMSRINVPFKYPDGTDNYCMIYPSAKEFLDQKVQIQKDFFSNFKFPKEFISTEEKRDFMAKTKFIISKENTVSGIDIKIKFKNPTNQKFQDYFFEKITNFIEKANWSAAVSCEIKVNSIFEINFYN